MEAKILSKINKKQESNIFSKATKLCHEVLDLIGTQDVSCSIHESEVTTSIVLKSKAIESPGFTIIKSKEAITKKAKALKNKMSTNRVRQATELEDPARIYYENQVCDQTSHEIELNQNDNLYSTLEYVTDLECNGYNQVLTCEKEHIDKYRKNDQMPEFLDNGKNIAEKGSPSGLYQREGIETHFETQQNSLPTW
jgi:hypothetical protein